MDDQKKKKKTIYVNGQEYPSQPGILDRFKEGFATIDDRAQLEAIRKRRALAYGS